MLEGQDAFLSGRVAVAFSQNRRLALACTATKMCLLQKRVWHRKHVQAYEHGVLYVWNRYLAPLSFTTNHSVYRTPSISSTNRTKPKQRATITIARQRSDTG